MDGDDRKPPPVTPSSISVPPVMSEDRTPSAASSGSGYLTPSSGISEDVFDWTFDHNVVKRRKTFLKELKFDDGKSGKQKFDVAKKKLRTFSDGSESNAGLEAACHEKEHGVRESFKKWFDNIDLSFDSRAMLSGTSGESALKTVFKNYAETTIREKHAFALEEFPDDPRGSLVTASCRQDLAFYVPTSGILFHGELKTAVRQKVDAIRQCAGYLFFQLWWFRTVQRRDVEAVYGFTVCSSKRNDSNTVVSLLILKVPNAEEIGANYQLYSHSATCPAKEAFDLLGSFLLIDFDNPFQKPEIPEQFHCPGCMLMPPSWLRESEEQSNIDWAMIKTGTGSLVIRCDNKATVLRLLKNHVRNRDEGQKEDLVTVQEAVPGSKKWILKCKTPASGKGWESAGAAINETRSELRDQLSREGNNDLHDIADKWLDMYPVGAVVDRHAGRSIVVTRYVGDDFSASEISYANFMSEFKMLIDRVIGLAEAIGLVHGDIHEGNIRLDKKGDVGWKLRLIDWDEASIDLATERIAVTDEQKARYPDCLRKLEGNLYTKNQLLLLFLCLNNKYEHDEERELWEQREQWEHGEVWSQWDLEVDYKHTPDELLPEEVTNKYNKLYDTLERNVNQDQGHTTQGGA